jgi:hypothetical protein
MSINTTVSPPPQSQITATTRMSLEGRNLRGTETQLVDWNWRKSKGAEKSEQDARWNKQTNKKDVEIYMFQTRTLKNILHLCNKENQCTLITYIVSHYYPPTCFGLFWDHHQGVIHEYKQYTNTSTKRITKTTRWYSWYLEQLLLS